MSIRPSGNSYFASIPALCSYDIRSQHSKNFLQELKKGCRIFEDFVDDGLIEYLDVNEMNDASIAVYENQIKPGTTHLEVNVLYPGIFPVLIPKLMNFYLFYCLLLS